MRAVPSHTHTGLCDVSRVAVTKIRKQSETGNAMEIF